MAFFVILSLQWFFQMNSDGTGYLAQRSMACRSDKEARMAAIIFSFTQVLIRSLCWLPIVVALLVIYPFTPADMVAEGFTKARKTFFAQGIQDLLPPGIRGLMLTALLTPRTEAEVLKQFFLRVHPAGFWAQSAAAAGENPRAVQKLLWQRLFETALCATTLFSWLYGFGKWLIHLPGESMLLPSLAIVLGAVLVPWWWRLLFQTEEVQEKAFKRRTGQLVLEE